MARVEVGSLFVSVLAFAGAAILPVAAAGEGVVSIVLPEEPSPTERHAADELAHYLGKVCGAKFSIVSEPQGANAPCIAVGRTARLRDAGVQLRDTELGLDGFVLRRAGPALLICGINDRGTLYGVYEFLHKHVGCGWYMPGEIGEFVPSRSDFSLPDINETHRPAFAWRGFTVPVDLADKTPGKGRDLAEWLVRNRVNTLYKGDGASDANEEAAFWAERGGMRKRWLTHSWGTRLPIGEYFAQHPEWYAMLHGKRFVRRLNAKFCTSNPEVVERIAQGAIDYLNAHPDAELYSITESDGLGWCECEKCKALDDGRVYETMALDAGGPEEARKHSSPVVTNRMVIFANAIAERVVRAHPKALLYILAYHADFLPPSGGLKPHPNVMIQVVHNRPNYICYNHPMESPCERNALFRRGLEEWIAISNHVTVYDYARHSQMMSLPFIAPRRFAEDMKYLKRVGVEGYLCQGSQVWGLYGIDYYAIAQAMWDPGVDIAAELEGFYSGLYGTAAPHMKRFYEKLETALRRHSCINLEDTRMLPAYLTPEVVAEAGKALSEAQAAARPGLEKQRVDMTAQCFDYARHYAAAERARWTCEKSGNLDDLRTAVAAYQALLDVFGGQASPSSLANDKAIKQSTGRLRALQAKLKAAESQQNQEPQGGQTQK